MNAHEHALELGAIRFDFDLSAAERRELDGHLATCGQCRSQLDGMAEDVRRFEMRPARRMPPHAAAAVRATLERPARRMSPAMVLVAAVLVLVAALATLAVGAEIQRRLDDGRLAIVPVPTAADETAIPAVPSPSTAVTPAVPAPPTITWTTVPEPDFRPKRGFEHAFFDSARGTMFQIRHLAGELTTIVATTRDGVTWTTDEVPSDTIPAGQPVNGGADWMQLVERANGRLRLMTSADGIAWEERSLLPNTLGSPWDSAVYGDAMLVCGGGRGDRQDLAECVSSSDGGATWTSLEELANAVRMGGIRGIVPLGAGFLVIIESETDGESVALTSEDGVAWVRQPAPIPNRTLAVGTIGGLVVACGVLAEADGYAASIVTSADGVTWEPAVMPDVEGSARELVRAGDVLVAPMLWNQPEGAEYARDVLLSADGRTWVAGGIPAQMSDWQSPTFLPVEDGIVAMGGEAGTLMVGRVTGGTSTATP